jgi:hypothetical protein
MIMPCVISRPDIDVSDAGHFSLLVGGPLFQFLCRTHLSGTRLQLARRRALVLSLFAWLPPFVLAALEGNAWGGAREPFLLDPAAYARFLVAVPLMIAAEVIAHRRMGLAVNAFVTRGLLGTSGLRKLESARAAALRLRNSRVVEAVLLAFVYVVGLGIIRRYAAPLHVDSWYSRVDGSGAHTTVAGWWYVLISVPLFQFILCRWYFRLGLWAWFLFRVSGAGIRLVPTHPDRSGGLGFLGEFTYSLAPFLMAHGAVAAGVAAVGIFYAGESFRDYGAAPAAIAAFLSIVVLGPILVFVPVLLRAKRRGLHQYGALGQRYVFEFDHKWIHGSCATAEPLLGSADLQSLADLGNSYQIIEQMRVLPIRPQTLAVLAIVTLLPFVPLLLTLVPLTQLLELLLKGLG